jgi:hypothetical protein
MKRTFRFGAGLALASLLASTTSAQEVFTWVSVVNEFGGTATASGTLTYTAANGGTVSDLTFNVSGFTSPDTVYEGTGPIILPDGDLVLQAGLTLGDGNSPPWVDWSPITGNFNNPSAGENLAESYPSLSLNVLGDWVPVAVPEPPTAALLLLFGAMTLGLLRNNRKGVSIFTG